jgi:hypothetical protein
MPDVEIDAEMRGGFSQQLYAHGLWQEQQSGRRQLEQTLISKPS